MPVVNGEGYAVANVADLGEGPGFRKVRRELGVEAFGVNAIVLPAGIETGFHFHDVQQEVYVLLEGRIEIHFGDGTSHTLEPGGIARVDAPVHRKIVNVHDGDSAYIVFGGNDGYVGRDGRLPEGESRVGQS